MRERECKEKKLKTCFCKKYFSSNVRLKITKESRKNTRNKNMQEKAITTK